MYRSRLTQFGVYIIRELIAEDGRVVSVTVWEPTTCFGPHATITTYDGHAGWYGALHTTRLTPELAALPARSDERWDAVTAYHRSLRERSAEIASEALGVAVAADLIGA